MRYLIDGNNLAGSLGIIHQRDFDLQVIFFVKEFFAGKKMEVNLIFDGRDIYGDRRQYGSIKAIYAEHDSRHKSADDKIIEILEQFKDHKENILVTDDIELTEKAQEVARAKNLRLRLIKAREFVEKYKLKFRKKDNVEEKLSSSEAAEITEELMKAWQIN